MKPDDFLSKLANQGVGVWVEKDRLCYRAPKGVLNSTILRELTENKQELLRFLTQEGDQAGLIQLPQIDADPAQRYQPFPLTDLQLAEWIGQESSFEVGNVGNHVYIEIDAIDLNVQRMQSALQRLIERHEMLRAILLPDGQQQILEHAPSLQVKVFDLRGKDQEVITAHLEQTRHSLDHQMIQVEQWPAFDLCVTLLDQRRSRLHLSIHFLFLDAASMGILTREFSMLYANPDAILDPLTLSFRDYTITWERERDQSPAYQRAREYWLERFPELPPAPELPLATNPYALAQPRFVPYQNQLDTETWTRLKTRAARSGITPSVVLFTAFAEVLATWSKSSRFSINLALSDRQPLHPQVKALVGNFSSFAPISFDYTRRETFENRARQVQEQVLDHLEYGQYSGMRMLKDLAKARGESGGAVLPIIFASALIQDDSNLSSSAGPWEKLVYTAVQAPQVWIEHPVLEIRGNLIFSWQVVEELFPKDLAAAMFEAYCQLLERLATQEEAWHNISSSLLPSAQLAQRTQLNQTEAPLCEELLHTLFLKQALRTPSARAVVTATQMITYQQLHQGASYLGRWLRERGAQPNRLVAIVMEKGWEQVVAAMGILYAGAAYVPIDPTLPGERLIYSLEHAEVDLILTQSWLDDEIVWEQPHQRFHVDKLDLDSLEAGPFSCVQTPRDLAYVIYTSGSTGQPKGVMIEHQAAVNTILDMNERFGINEKDRLLSPSALHFDWSVYDIFGALAAGGTLVLPPEEAKRDPGEWLSLMQREQVTVWTSVPALLQMLADYALGSEDRGELSSLRLAFLGGDWIPLALPGQIKQRAPEVEVISVGGATEASIVSIYYPIKEIKPEWKSIPYG
ncbi:MAG TPA: AMP-binding protein, partial [Ktedonobacteraceae bacterium]